MGPRRNTRKNPNNPSGIGDVSRESDSSFHSPPRNNPPPLIHTPLGSHPSSSGIPVGNQSELPGSHAQNILGEIIGNQPNVDPPCPPNPVENQIATQMAQVIQTQMGAFFDRFLQNQQQAVGAVQQARDQQQQRLLQEFRQQQDAERQVTLERHNNLIQAIDRQQSNYLNARPPIGNASSNDQGSRVNASHNLQRNRVVTRSEENLLNLVGCRERNENRATNGNASNQADRPHISLDINPLPMEPNAPRRMLAGTPIGGSGSIRNPAPTVYGFSQLPVDSTSNISGSQTGSALPLPQLNHHHSNHHMKTTEVPKYIGAADKKTPFDFILELEKYRDIARGSEQFILKEILPIALEGTAYHWFRHEIAMYPFATWEDFKVRFRREFQALGYLEELNRELELRTQGPTEPLTVFIRVILDYYERLGRQSSEEEKVGRIMRQMHPEYLQVLQGKAIHNIRELKEAAFQAQDIIKAYRMYRPPPTSISVEPSLAWHPLDRNKETNLPETEFKYSSLPGMNSGTPRVHFSSVDPFTYFHNQTPRKQVTFNETVAHKPINSPSRNSEPRFPSRSSPAGFSQRNESPSRERRNSGESDNGGQRLCYKCQSPDHLRNECPLNRPKSPNSGNSMPPPSPNRQ